MHNKPTLSAKDVIKVLDKKFGFQVVSQKGSHIKMKKQEEGGKRITIVPNHKELAPGTLKGVLNLAKISQEDFWQKYYE